MEVTFQTEDTDTNFSLTEERIVKLGNELYRYRVLRFTDLNTKKTVRIFLSTKQVYELLAAIAKGLQLEPQPEPEPQEKEADK